MTDRHDEIQKSYNDIGIDSKLDRARTRKLMLIGNLWMFIGLLVIMKKAMGDEDV